MTYATLLRKHGYVKSKFGGEKYLFFEKTHPQNYALIKFKKVNRKLATIETLVSRLITSEPYTVESLNDYNYLEKELTMLKDEIIKQYNLKEVQ